MDQALVPTDTFRVKPEPKALIRAGLGEIKTEMVRKGIHFLVAFAPVMAHGSRFFALAFLAGGTLFYAAMEALRRHGINVPFISFVTRTAARERDSGRFVLGPVTLGVGAFLSLLVYRPPASTVAVFALAFGDGFASLAGKVFGTLRPPFLAGKSIEGSAACFVAVLASAWFVTKNLPLSLLTAAVAAVTEALPLEDYDNIALPLAAGAVTSLFL